MLYQPYVLTSCNLLLHHVSQCTEVIFLTCPYATSSCRCSSTEDNSLQLFAAGRPLPLRHNFQAPASLSWDSPAVDANNDPHAGCRLYLGLTMDIVVSKGWLTLGLTVTTIPLHDTSHMALCYTVLCSGTRPAQLRPAWLASPHPCCSMCRCLAGLLTFGSRLPRERSVAS